MSKVCKFFLNGNCNYGSSCRFLHSENRSSRYDNQYYKEYPQRYLTVRGGQYPNDKYSQSDKHYDKGNYRGHDLYDYQTNSNRNFQPKSDYNQRNNHYEDPYYFNQSTKKEYDVNNYNVDSYNSNNRSTDYTRRQYKDTKEYDYHSKNEYKGKNVYYDVYDRSFHNLNHNQSQDTKYVRRNVNNEVTHQSNNENIQEHFANYKAHSNSNRHTDSMNNFNSKQNYVQDNINQNDHMFKTYLKEIKVYQAHVKQHLESNIWPLTCYHPIGNSYPVQPVGCLNFIDVSFEELRCDYYLIKTVCANPKLVHGQALEELLLKARNQKKDILSMNNHVKNDILATFEKCAKSKADPTFQNSILPDKNSYWDMSIRHLKPTEANKSEFESFSFSTKGEENPGASNLPSVKIMMQTDVYGKMDCDAFAQDSFTDYIPIIPPPENRCF